MKHIKKKGKASPGLLELTTHSLQRAKEYETDFGIVRVVEILGGDENWVKDDVTFESFLDEKHETEVINGQMIIDWAVNSSSGSKTYFTINRPVMQWLLEGKTKGLIIKPLGAIHASFFSKKSGNEIKALKLHFSIVE